jgi:hypothetical protein
MAGDYRLSEKAAAILDQFPGPVTLYPEAMQAKARTVFGPFTLLFLGIAVWSALDSSMGAIPGAFSLALAGAFGFLTVRLLRAKSGVATLDANALTYQMAFGSPRRFAWKDVDGFATFSGRYSDVGVNFEELTTSATFPSVKPSLPDRYGLQPIDLAHLLTAWRERALARSS